MRVFSASILLLAVAWPASAGGTLRAVDMRAIPGAGDVAITDHFDSAGTVKNVVLTLDFNGNRVISHTFGSSSVLVDGVQLDTCNGPRQLALEPKVGPGPIDEVRAIQVCSRSNEVAEYGASAGGGVNFVTKAGSGGTDPADVAVTKDGKYAFTVNLASKSLSVLQFDRLNHSLTLRGEYTVPYEPTHVDVGRNGIVAVAGTNPNYFGTFRLDRSTGTLFPIAGVMLMQRPTAMALADEVGGPSSSQLAYVGWRSTQAGVEDQIATYRVERTGNFSFVANTAAGLFLTDLVATYDRLFTATVSPGAKDQVLVHKRLGDRLTPDASLEFGDSPPSFKQIDAAPSWGRRTTIAVTGFQAGWLRSFEYTRDDDPICTPSATRLCQNGNRFEVSTEYRVPSQGLSGYGVGGAITPDTGHFYFFTANNIELVTKSLNGSAVNNSFWFFYGGLTDVWFDITVRDVWSGRVRLYENPPGTLASVGDTSAFPDWSGGWTMGARGVDAESAGRELAPLSSAVPFFIRVDWRVPSQGTSGRAQGVVLTSDTAYFWFFSPNNVEVVVKVVDGRAFNGYWWVFYGALSDVEYTITITDQATGQQKVYFNPSGTMASVADTAAFSP